MTWNQVARQHIYSPETNQKTDTRFDMNAFNAVTGGVFNRLSPVQNLRFGYDLLTGNKNAWNGYVYGNNGIVSDSFAQEHPYLSILFNGATDAGIGLGAWAAANPAEAAELASAAGSFVRNIRNKAKIKPVTITTENAASVTPEQWTAAQDAAIARGDWTEAQRLRYLHGDIYGYKIRGSHASKVSDDFTEFNTGLKIKGTNKTPTIYNDSRDVTAGAFFGDNSNGVINQFGKPRDFLLKIDNPLQVDAYGMRYNRLLPPGTTKEDIIKAVNNLKAKGYTEEQIDAWIEGQFTSNADDYALKVYNSSVNDGAIIKNIYEGRMNPAYMENAVPTTDYIITKPSQAKSANAVTFDDNGVRIPLGLRDNFKLNDIRYGILPFIGLGVPAFRQGDKH